jgi:hypothetical protein
MVSCSDLPARIVTDDGRCWEGVAESFEINKAWDNAFSTAAKYEATCRFRVPLSDADDLHVDCGDTMMLHVKTPHDNSVCSMRVMCSQMDCTGDIDEGAPVQLTMVLSSSRPIVYSHDGSLEDFEVNPDGDWVQSDPAYLTEPQQFDDPSKPTKSESDCSSIKEQLDEVKKQLLSGMKLPPELVKPASTMPNAPPPDPEPVSYERPKRRVRLRPSKSGG